MPTPMNEEARGNPAFACCSAGIGRWFWVAWESEDDARVAAPALATGYEKSAARAEAKAAERVGPELTRLPARWASGYMRGGAAGGSGASRGADGGEGGDAPPRPRSRFSRPVGAARRRDAAPRLAFLYCAAEGESAGTLGGVTITRHRIVKQTAGKIHVESEPFDEDEWARRTEAGAEPDPSARAPKVRTLAVDRAALRADGRFRSGPTHGNRTFYASEEAGLRDVAADLAARHPWCDALGVRLPCTLATVKAAYRRLARATHPDAGGDPAAFRAVEGAYRAALADFAQPGEPPS
jgi:hypothetical protein